MKTTANIKELNELTLEEIESIAKPIIDKPENWKFHILFKSNNNIHDSWFWCFDIYLYNVEDGSIFIQKDTYLDHIMLLPIKTYLSMDVLKWSWLIRLFSNQPFSTLWISSSAIFSQD